MKRNPFYLLREISGVPYLLPYGNSIASHDRGVKLNETGLFLWEQLQEEHTAEELIRLCAEHYDASEEEMEELRSDLMPFLDDLVRCGALLPDGEGPFKYRATLYKSLRIAGLTVRLEGPEAVFSKLFDPFEDPSLNAVAEAFPGTCSAQTETSVHTPTREDTPNQDGAPDMTVSVCAGICPYQVPGNAILRNSMMSVIDCDDYFEIQFHANTQLKEVLLKKDASKAIFYYRLPYDETLTEEIFHGIREVFLYLAGLQGMVALHSTSILYKDKAWLFSGHSGMGKSTHAHLWEESFGTPILNGDLNLLAMQDGKPVIHGIPWCGTSEISDTKTHPLGGITLLNRAQTNFVTELSPDQKLLLVDQRLISHSWTPQLFDQNLKVIKKIAPEILICKLCCTKDPEAAVVMRNRIDTYLNKA
ncbi:MAG: PqqD family protein [Lachnospiraceae bacterium]|nr:PqqD family protein [Lachnospiraceae bacterium]